MTTLTDTTAALVSQENITPSDLVTTLLSR